MKSIAYEVQPNDTPRQIAKRFTGNPARWEEMIPVNPKIPVVHDGQVGKAFSRKHIVPGMLMHLPGEWSGMVGATCEDQLPVVEPHPEAFYRVQGTETVSEAAYNKFGRTYQANDGNLYGDHKTLMGANRGDVGGFVMVGSACLSPRWKSGELFRVPKAWLNTSDPISFPKKALPYLVKADGSPWTPGSSPTGNGCPGGTYLNPSTGMCQAFPQCAEGEVFDPVTMTCKKASGDKVNAGDESFFKKNLGWLAAAGVVLGIGGALTINHFTKARKVEGQRLDEKKGRPALPAHKDEVR